MLSLKDQLSVYPNPANDVLNISSYQATYKNIHATLTDIKGAVVKRAAANDGMLQINTTDVTPGIYMLHITADGRETSYKINIAH